jgi:hypothetical protein
MPINKLSSVNGQVVRLHLVYTRAYTHNAVFRSPSEVILWLASSFPICQTALEKKGS